MGTTSPYVYKFKGRFPAVATVGLMVGLCMILAIVDVRQGDGFGGAIFCLCIAFFFLLLGGIFFLGKANIVIDDESVSRTILGNKFKVIQWRDVERITVFPVRGAGVTPNVVGYNVIASRNRSDLSNTRKIYFGNQGNNLSGLIACMNIYVARFNIQVERTTDGIKTIVKSIPD